VVPIENSAGRETGGEHALIQISEDTGGKYYYATSMSQLDDAFRQISDELRTQYCWPTIRRSGLSNSQFRAHRSRGFGWAGGRQLPGAATVPATTLSSLRF